MPEVTKRKTSGPKWSASRRRVVKRFREILQEKIDNGEERGPGSLISAMIARLYWYNNGDRAETLFDWFENIVRQEEENGND